MLTHNTRPTKGSATSFSLAARRTIADDIVANLATLKESNDSAMVLLQKHEDRIAKLEHSTSMAPSLVPESLERSSSYTQALTSASTLLVPMCDRSRESDKSDSTELRISRAEVLIVDMKTELDRISKLIEDDELFAMTQGDDAFHQHTEESQKEGSDMVSISLDTVGTSDLVELGTASDIPSELPVVCAPVLPSIEEHVVESGAPADLVGAYTIEEDEDDGADATDAQREFELDQAMAENVSAISARLDSLHVKQPGELKKKVQEIEASFRLRQLERRRQRRQNQKALAK
jgi:hypothetical protein